MAPRALSDPASQAEDSSDASNSSLLRIHCTNFQFAASVRRYLWSAICCIFYISTTALIATGPTLMWFTSTRQKCPLNLSCLSFWSQQHDYGNQNTTETCFFFLYRTNHRVSVETSPSRSHGRSLSRCGWSAAPLWSSPMTAAHRRSPSAS